MTVLEYMPVSRRVQILDDGDRMKAAMESLFEKEDPSFRITIMILYAFSLPLSYT